ncbi:MAG: a-glycosyltransferase, Glycosyltransferase Family 4-like protein [Ramlibacter sp.]|nr:a-glycosyltransferase, Glycosyltransferase Family 4-like protein [Ramlibacter sp.]
MFKIADYLLQAGGRPGHPDAARLLPLDTRGGGSAVLSIGVLLTALGRLVRGRLSGELAGVHVNMAERLSLVRKSVVIVFCKALGIPVVLHLHAAQLHHSYRTFSLPARALVRWVFSLPASCVVLGQTSARFVIDELRVPQERVEIVTNGVPDPKVPRRNAQARAGAKQRLLFIGNLSDRKGVPELLRSLRQPPLADLPLELTLAGGGDVHRYRSLADTLGLGQAVRFNGWTSQEAVGRLLADADVLVLPSHDEGLPLAILEALAHGVAVVCTPVGEIPHVLTDGVDACFVDPGDAGSIADGLARVLSDGEFRERLERNGRALHQQKFSLERFSASVARVHMRHFGVSSVSGPEPAPRENAP